MEIFLERFIGETINLFKIKYVLSILSKIGAYNTLTSRNLKVDPG